MKKTKTVSRQRMHQLRRLARGLCIISGCIDPLVTKNHCAKHAKEANAREQARYHARKQAENIGQDIPGTKWREANTPSAYREAGHAIVGQCLGVPVVRITLRASLGRTKYALVRRLPPIVRRCAITVAGNVAESIYDPSVFSTRRDHGDTEILAADVQRAFPGDKQKQDALKIDATELATRIITRHWTVVHEFAMALLAKQILRKREIRQLLRHIKRLPAGASWRKHSGDVREK